MTAKRTFFPLMVVILILVAGLYLWWQYSPMEIETSLSVTFKNLPGDLTVSGHPPKEVEVVVRGQKVIMAALQARKRDFVLDLSGAEAGLVTLPVEAADLDFPENAAIVHLEPDSITLRLEPKLVKTVPVTVLLSESAPATGYTVEFTQTTPATLRISGPEKIIAPMKQLMTLPVSVKDAAESFKKEVAVDLPEEVTVGGNDASVVTVQIIIKETVTTRRFENVPVEGRNTLLPTTLSPPVMAIDVEGSENVLSALSVDADITAYVDLEELSPGVYVRRPQITLPVGTTLVGADPEVVTVVIGQ